MKKAIIIIFLIPLIGFTQKMQKPENPSKDQQKTMMMKNKMIIDQWEEYSKAFEYADYNKIVSYFAFPVTFGIMDEPQILNNKEELLELYKNIRSNVQDGYKYSLLEKSKVTWLSKDICMIDATYSRFNSNYKRIFIGRGIYMYKRIDDQWKMFSVSGIPMKRPKRKK